MREHKRGYMLLCLLRDSKLGLYVLMGEIHSWFFKEGVRVYRRLSRPSYYGYKGRMSL
jgi:hypothetical protein